MKIVCGKFKTDKGSRGKFVKRTAALASIAAVAGTVYITANNYIGMTDMFTVNGSSSSSVEVQSSEEEAENLTVDDDLTDIYLGGEEIDTGVSAEYNGKLDIPANVRLDKIDFGDDFSKPLDSARVTSLFDYRVNPVTGRYVFHTGMDLGAANGSDIHAMQDGKVIRATYDGGYGNFVIIQHPNGIQTLYAHCSKLKVKKGDSVKKGQVVALVGSTGNSTGPHLHIEFRRDNQRYDPEWVIGGIYG